MLGKLVAVRCPAELAHILHRAGAVWEPGSGRWLVQRRRIRPVIRRWSAPLTHCSLRRSAFHWRPVRVEIAKPFDTPLPLRTERADVLCVLATRQKNNQGGNKWPVQDVGAR
jgi:hypothetical protein